MTDGQNACDEIAFRALHSFLVEVQTKAGYVHASPDACVKTTWRSGLRAPLEPPNNNNFKKFKTRQYLSERNTEACDQAALLLFLPTYALSRQKRTSDLLGL